MRLRPRRCWWHGSLDGGGLTRQHAPGHELTDLRAKLGVRHHHRFAATSIRAMTIASMLRSDLMALRLNFSASSRRSSSVRTSLTYPGIDDGFARRDTATRAAVSGAKDRGRRFGDAVRGRSG